LVNIIYPLEIITGIVAFWSFKKYTMPYYKYFLWYIVTVVLFESIGWVYNLYELPGKYQVFNIYTFFEFNFVSLIYYKLTKELFSKRSIKFLMVLFNFIYFVSFLYTPLKDYTIFILAIILSFFMILYLKELLNSDEIISFKERLSFWITIAFLFYYLATIPYYTALYLIIHRASYLFYLHHGVLIITYLCFIYGLLCSKKEPT